MFSALPSTANATSNASKVDASASRYELRLFETHRDRTIDIVYRQGDEYIPSALNKLDHFLRDHLNNDTYDMDPHVFDLLHALLVKVGRPNAVIDIICGYRSPSTNAYLRSHSDGVASHSLHMKGEAIDIRVPGVPLSKLRKAALSLHLGGVGYYPHSDFIHVDVGRVRQWVLK
ncbi:MAG: DUF882 domain-containing protein [Acidobacteriota bacterium]|nr:DUF882 domain-containing protein [Acidobacteriota bacterium]